MSTRVCLESGCPVILTDGSTRCGAHARRRSPDTRPTASARGYDARWRRVRAQFLKLHPVCALCPAQATVADHHPVERRDLLAAGEPHPDAHHHLRGLCSSCHGRKSAREAARARRKAVA